MEGEEELDCQEGGLEGRLRGRMEMNKMRCQVMKREVIEGWMSDIRT